MKIRNGFVSNSSSSSFMINGGDIKEISLSMIDTIIEEFEDGPYPKEKERRENKKNHKGWRDNLEIALKRKDVRNGKIGITMPSCNEDTYLLIKDGYLYISTCNNHHWDFDAVDCGENTESDKIYSIINDGYYYNIRNKKIHSYEFLSHDDNDKSKCNNCDGYYGNYVIDRKGNRLCGSCYKGKLGPTDEAKIKMLREGSKNPIISLELNEE